MIQNAVRLSFFRLIFVAKIHTVNVLTTRTSLVLLPSFAAKVLQGIAGEGKRVWHIAKTDKLCAWH